MFGRRKEENAGRGCRLGVLAGIGLAVIATTLPANADEGCKYTVGWAEFPPYAIPSDNGVPRGVDIEYLQTVLNRRGCQVVFRNMPWIRAQIALEHGVVDILPYIAFNQKRESYGHFSIPYRDAVTGVLMRRDDKRLKFVHTLQDLGQRAMRIGVVRGVWNGPRLNELKQGHPDLFEEYAETSLRVPMLLSGRADAIIDDRDSLVFDINQRGLSQRLVVLDIEVDRRPFHLLFSRKTVTLDEVQEINRLIELVTYRRLE
ncbi:substrate-binding periplasmic protein [Aestuariispira insulae]|nr:transporter substrate-binding domain-containing protein [Aestuariispira insulae]